MISQAFQKEIRERREEDGGGRAALSIHKKARTSKPPGMVLPFLFFLIRGKRGEERNKI